MIENFERLPPVTEDMIGTIWSEYQLGTVTHIKKLHSGVRNLSFLVNHSVILRFNTRDRDSAKFQSERLAYEILARQSIPVPQVVVLDDSHQLTPYDFIITARLPGQTVAQSWESLSSLQLYTLIYEIGKRLVRIHENTFPAFGKLHSLNYTSWADYVYDYIERYLRLANDNHLLDKDLKSSVERSREYAMLDFAGVTSPALIHGDFHYENILQVNGQLSGILDFEWALAGDRSYDFMIADVRERMVPKSEPILGTGYQSLRPFSPEHERRVIWYRLFLQLEETVMYARMGEGQRAMSSLQQLRQLIVLTEHSES